MSEGLNAPVLRVLSLGALADGADRSQEDLAAAINSALLTPMA